MEEYNVTWSHNVTIHTLINWEEVYKCTTQENILTEEKESCFVAWWTRYEENNICILPQG